MITQTWVDLALAAWDWGLVYTYSWRCAIFCKTEKYWCKLIKLYYF